MSTARKATAGDVGEWAVARYAVTTPDTTNVRAAGRIVAYSDGPQVCIEVEGYGQMWWQADLTEVTPEPAEPRRLGAVVESFEGSVWVRGHHNNQKAWVRTAFGEHRNWDDIPRPLKVLHEGYTPDAE